MAETVTNLKVRFGADTKNFKQDLDSGKAAVTNFTGAAGGAFAEFASIFGINMGAVTATIASTNKSLALLSGGFKGAAVGAGIFTGALKILRLALISTGIGAIIVALGSLVAYFTKTEKGAEAVERVMASFKAVVNVLIDRFAILGEGIYKLFTGDFKGGWDAMKQSVAGIGTELVNEAKAAADLERSLQALEDREIALITVQGERKQKIAELREEAKREETTAKTKLELLKQVIGLEKQITSDEVSIQKEKVRIWQEQYNMGSKMDEATRNLQESKRELNIIEAQGLNNIRALSREMSKATNEIEAETAAIIKLRLEESKDLKPITGLGITTPDFGVGLETDKLEASAAKIKSIYGDLQTHIMDFSQVFNESMNNVAVGFGESLGNMLTGAGSLSDLGGMVGSALGDMAISVGKIAISTGIAAMAIGESLRKAIATPAAGLVAIAAGVALVALGTAVKGSLSSAASGGGGTFSSANTGGYNTGTTGVQPANVRSSPQTIYVTGSFKAQGKELIAVIDKTQQRQLITT